MKNLIDLHSHTQASDGILKPAELVDLAVERGLKVLAITDHDTVDGIAEAQAHAKAIAAKDPDRALDLWPGIELSTDVPGTEVHMLGYFVDHTDQTLAATLAGLREGRLDRAQEIVGKLHGLGMTRVSLDRIYEIAGEGALGRPHIAQAMIEAGYVQTSQEAFDRYIGRTGPAYFERIKLTPEDSIEIILKAGGLPVLAHPMYMEPPHSDPKELIGFDKATGKFDIKEYIKSLIPLGLVGVEAYYSNYTPKDSRRFEAIARELGLIPTGGTDYHGGLINQVILGEVVVPWTTIERMLEWRKAHSAAR